MKNVCAAAASLPRRRFDVLILLHGYSAERPMAEAVVAAVALPELFREFLLNL